MNFDRDIRDKMEGLEPFHSNKNWSKMESLLNEEMPLADYSSFDQDIKEKLTHLEATSNPDWSRMNQALDEEMGEAGDNFDHVLAAKVLQFNPEKNANWDKMAQALDNEVAPGKYVHLFDRQIKRALAALVAAGQPRWNDMSFALDADPVLGDPQAFDTRVKEEMENTDGPGAASESWPRMEQQLQTQEMRRKRIIRSKFAELAAVLLLLISFPGLFTLMNQSDAEKAISGIGQTGANEEGFVNQNRDQRKASENVAKSIASLATEQAGRTLEDKAAEEISSTSSVSSPMNGIMSDGEVSADEGLVTVEEVSKAPVFPALEKDKEKQEIAGQEQFSVKTFESLAFIPNKKVFGQDDLKKLPDFLAFTNEEKDNIRVLPLFYVAAQAQFRHHEIFVPGFSGDNKLYYHNQIQPGLAIGLTNGLWDLEIGASPFHIQHEGLSGQHTFVDYPEEEATYKRSYLNSQVSGWIVPLRGRYHMPINGKLSLHALAGFSGTFLTESEQLFQEEFHDWIDEEPQGGDPRPDRVVKLSDSDFFLDAELGLGMNYRLNQRWRVFAEGSTFIPLEGTRNIGENADEYAQYGLNFGVQFILK